jgi:hypothetical protein
VPWIVLLLAPVALMQPSFQTRRIRPIHHHRTIGSGSYGLLLAARRKCPMRAGVSPSRLLLAEHEIFVQFERAEMKFLVNFIRIALCCAWWPSHQRERGMWKLLPDGEVFRRDS